MDQSAGHSHGAADTQQPECGAPGGRVGCRLHTGAALPRLRTDPATARRAVAPTGFSSPSARSRSGNTARSAACTPAANASTRRAGSRSGPSSTREGFRYQVVSERGSDSVRNKVLKAVLKREQELVAAGATTAPT